MSLRWRLRTISTCIPREYTRSRSLALDGLLIASACRRKHANGMMAEAMGMILFTFAEGKAN